MSIIRRAGTIIAALLLLAGHATGARAQAGDALPVEQPPAARARPLPLPDLDESVRELLDAAYHSDEERADLRVRHGAWTDEDRAIDERSSAQAVERAARIALLSGDIGAGVLADERASPLLRALGKLEAGDAAGAQTLLGAAQDGDGAETILARGRALLATGKREEARAELRRGEARIRAGVASMSSGEIASLVRCCVLLARVQESPVEAGAVERGGVSFQTLLDTLAFARDQVDRLDPAPVLAEAVLLLEKNNYAQAGEALEMALTLRGRDVEALTLLGTLSALSFDFPRADRIAATLDGLAQGEESVAGCEVRALARLREIEGTQALSELAPALARFPTRRTLMELEAAAHAVAFDDAATREALARLDALAPGAPEGFMLAGDGLALARQYPEAAALLREASERAPGWAEPAVELGLSELQAGRLLEARAALEHAARLDTTNVRASNSLTLLREMATYQTVEGEHFIVRFKPGQDEILAREMLPELERIHERVAGNGPGGIDFEPPQKTVVEVYPNQRWFATRITGLPSLHTFAAATGPVIAMEAPRSGPGHLVGPYDWRRVVQHEYTHTVTLARTKNRLPHWFTEASAVYLEDAPKDWGTAQLLAGAIRRGTLFDFDTINIKFIRPEKPAERAQAYAQGAWMYEYIVERWGARAPLELMDFYATGVREEEAFARVLKLSRAEFLHDFEAWATGQIRSWGLVEPEGGPSIDALLAGAKAEEPDAGLAQRWLEEHPEHPLVLDLAVKFALQESAGEATAAMVPLLRRHARARPLDPTAHRLMARLALSEGAEAAGLSALDAIEHLEFLDAREQHSVGYASELARLYARRATRAEGASAKEDWKRAIGKATRATQLSPYDATVRELAATIALRAGNTKRAEHHIEALTILEPEREIHTRRLEAVRKKAGGD